MCKSALSFVLVSVFVTSALADELVVASGRFHLTWEEQDVPERAAMIKDKVIYAARENGWDVNEVDTTCREPACLDRLLAESAADEAVYVKVDENVGEYTMDVHFARRESFSIDFTGSFPQALSALRDKIKEALAPSRGDEPAPPVEAPHPGRAAQPAHADAAESLLPAAQHSSLDTTKGLGPVPFWVSLGVTGSALVAYVASGIAGDAKWEKVAAEPVDSRTKSDQNSLSGIQTFNRVLLGVSLGGALTTGVLFLLTDFKGEKPRENQSGRGASLSPVLWGDGGGISVEGRF